ncbi:hypothetical protein C5E24_06750 [Pectobacterium parmentieri]|uniref:hypothetical protein n=1 Tax=Pectobacterium parmentieri TaxID=1905730 RepID=UPI000EB4D9ED|nr:hypothetical protein [Pectobacterium parmentieri]AYH09408.1 hypothetical protein C5E24_06750 [Pectobacterium parmentieri]
MKKTKYLLVGGIQNGDIVVNCHRNVGDRFVSIETNDYGQTISDTYEVTAYRVPGHPNIIVASCGDITEGDVISAAKAALL